MGLERAFDAEEIPNVTVQRDDSEIVIQSIQMKRNWKLSFKEKLVNLNLIKRNVDKKEVQSIVSSMSPIRPGDRFGSLLVVARAPGQIIFRDVASEAVEIVWLSVRVHANPLEPRRPTDELVDVRPSATDAERSAMLYDPARVERLLSLMPSKVEVSIAAVRFDDRAVYEGWLQSLSSSCQSMSIEEQQMVFDRFKSKFTAWPTSHKVDWPSLRHDFSRQVLKSLKSV